ANDGEDNSNAATVEITVGEPPVDNNPPEADDDSFATDFETALSVPAATGVLDGDTDLDGDNLTAVLENGPANGTLTLNDDGSFDYTPDAGFSGTDSFTYFANDGEDNSNAATVELTVGDPPVENTPPVADDDSFATDFGTVLTVSADAGVLDGDTDIDGDDLTAVLDSGPANGTLTLNEDGSFEYTPDEGFSGTDSFTYVANDGTEDSNVATATIEVAASDVPVVSFEIIPSEVSEADSFEERTITFQYTVDGPIPDDGLSVLVSLDNLGDFTSQGLEVGPSNFINLDFGPNFFEDINAFDTIITGQTGSFDVVLEDDLIQEEDVTVTFFELLPDPDGLLDNPYAVNPDANIGTISITDGIDEFPTSPVVGFSVDDTDLVEGDEVTATFNVEGDIPEDGITVVFGSDTNSAALEFDPTILTDPDAASGIAFPPTVTNDSVLVTIIEPTASITLKVAEDGIVEGVEDISISLFDGELYELDSEASEVTLTIADADDGSVLAGTDGRDRIFGTEADEQIEGFGDSDALRGFGGSDTILAGDGNDQVFGDIPNTFGEGGDDFIDGGAGNDELRGNGGDDTILGGAGLDRIFAGEGDDVIRGGEGDDILKGDSFRPELGNDTFVLAVGEGTDTILDFQPGEDLIGLADGLTFSDLGISDSDGFAEIASGDETLALLNNVSASDLDASLFVVV
ncbi:MAG: Ig-like domain-containing protein, partial [Cyanobacteria bacterium P01_E01_bin.48]